MTFKCIYGLRKYSAVLLIIRTISLSFLLDLSKLPFRLKLKRVIIVSQKSHNSIIIVLQQSRNSIIIV